MFIHCISSIGKTPFVVFIFAETIFACKLIILSRSFHYFVNRVSSVDFMFPWKYIQHRINALFDRISRRCKRSFHCECLKSCVAFPFALTAIISSHLLSRKPYHNCQIKLDSNVDESDLLMFTVHVCVCDLRVCYVCPLSVTCTRKRNHWPKQTTRSCFFFF